LENDFTIKQKQFYAYWEILQSLFSSLLK